MRVRIDLPEFFCYRHHDAGQQFNGCKVFAQGHLRDNLHVLGCSWFLGLNRGATSNCVLLGVPRMKLSEDRIGKPICRSLKTKSLQHVTSFPEIPYYFS